MAPWRSPADRKLILITGGAVVVAALLFAAAIVFGTPNEEPSQKESGPLYLGDAADLREKIASEPALLREPVRRRQLLARQEDGEIVALDIRLPDTESVQRGVARTGQHLPRLQRRRHRQGRDWPAIRSPTVAQGNRKGSVYVNLKRASIARRPRRLD